MTLPPVERDGAPPQAKKAVFARLGSRPIPRVVRMMNAAKGQGYDTVFLAARREAGLSDEEEYSGHNVKRIGPFFPLLNGKSGFLYLRSILNYNRMFLRELFELRPDLVHCSDIETMPAGLVYKWRSGARLLYNIHDNLAQRYNIPAWAQFALNAIEGVAACLADVVLVPEAFRRAALPAWSRSKVSVVRNTPSDPGVQPPPAELAPIRLFFGGWLDEGRGLRQLLELVRDHADFHLTLAGEGAPELVAQIQEAPRTTYLGFLEHGEIMRETARAHVIAALYDPVRPINRYAASNKLAEALACGRPVLANTEMLIVETLSAYDCLVKLPYDELIEKAPGLLREMMQGEGERYRAKCAAARAAFNEFYAWEAAEEAMIQAISER